VDWKPEDWLPDAGILGIDGMEGSEGAANDAWSNDCTDIMD